MIRKLQAKWIFEPEITKKEYDAKCYESLTVEESFLHKLANESKCQKCGNWFECSDKKENFDSRLIICVECNKKMLEIEQKAIDDLKKELLNDIDDLMIKYGTYD